LYFILQKCDCKNTYVSCKNLCVNFTAEKHVKGVGKKKYLKNFESGNYLLIHPATFKLGSLYDNYTNKITVD